MDGNEPILGIVGASQKPDERRVPLDPRQVERIPPDLRRRIVLQRGYGEPFGVSDAALEALVGGLMDRAPLFERSDVVVLAKPSLPDFAYFRRGQAIWGWPHCVQNEHITQTAIDKRLTLIAWESMNRWSDEGTRGLHVFHRNNEIAGYAGVLHALGLHGRTGLYGPPARAAVIHFGLTGRGAIHALQGLGFRDVTCFAFGPPEALAAPVPGVHYRRMGRREGTPDAVAYDEEGRARSFPEEIAKFDVVVNCVFQDTDDPLFFLRREDLPLVRHGTLLVDVSCDRGLGFDFARPTTFERPTFEVGEGVTYYGVDHTPSLLWRSATWEIGRALLPYLPVVMGGPEAWAADPVIRRAIEIQDGVVVNPRILRYQDREEAYPHAKRA